MFIFTLIGSNKHKFERRNNEIDFQGSISGFHNGNIFFSFEVPKGITEAMTFWRNICLNKTLPLGLDYRRILHSKLPVGILICI